MTFALFSQEGRGAVWEVSENFEGKKPFAQTDRTTLAARKRRLRLVVTGKIGLSLLEREIGAIVVAPDIHPASVRGQVVHTIGSDLSIPSVRDGLLQELTNTIQRILPHSQAASRSRSRQ